MILPGSGDVDVLIANYHAPQEVNIENTILTLQKFGIKNIRMQKDIFDPELFFKLLNLASFGDLNRMPQFKVMEEDKRTAQLLTYPVLMTHDVVGYQEVIVGEDQKAHLDYARKLLRKYNSVFKTNIYLPKTNVVVGRVKDLRNTSQKMSKSSPDGCLFLDDTPDDIKAKLKSATADKNGRENLEFLYREFVNSNPPEMNVKLKEELAEALIYKFK